MGLVFLHCLGDIFYYKGNTLGFCLSFSFLKLAKANVVETDIPAYRFGTTCTFFVDNFDSTMEALC